jgi:O-antigen/teichoic acid export membrane protein
VTSFTSSRARRIFGGWSANLVGLLLALTQQIILIPLFLKYWSAETLSAWLAIFAAGNLILIGDLGLHLWSLNRLLQFKSREGCDLRSSRFYNAMLRLLIGYTGLLVAAILALFAAFPPSRTLGFSAEPHFDLSFTIMTVGMALTIPGNLMSALYRARGRYGRVGNFQALALAIGQIGQVVGIMMTGSLLATTIAFVTAQVAVNALVAFFDVYRQFPFLRASFRGPPWRWIAAQFGGAVPFSVANIAEFGLSYLSVMLIGIFISDRIAIAQWSLTRTIVNLLRQVGFQATLPLAAELGHDRAIGAQDSLQRLYVRGSVMLVLLVATATSGALVFWPDFFALWTDGAIPYDATLSIALLIGTCVSTPALLALSYANYTNRGPLLLRAKTLQLVLFLALAPLLIPRYGPLGAAIAMIASELIAQSGFIAVVMVGETVRRPVRYALLLAAMMTTIVVAGAALGEAIRHLVPGQGLVHFVAECAVWLAAVAIAAAPLLRRQFRERLLSALSRF